MITEGPTDVTILAAAWSALNPGRPMPFRLYPSTGAAQLQNFLNNTSLAAVGRVVGLFDFDQEGFDRWTGVWKRDGQSVQGTDAHGLIKRHATLPAWSMLLPVPNHRQEYAGTQFERGYRLTIELLFSNAAIPTYMRRDEPQVGGGTLTVFVDGFKKQFSELVGGFADDEFACFEPVFARIVAVIAERAA